MDNWFVAYRNPPTESVPSGSKRYCRSYIVVCNLMSRRRFRNNGNQEKLSEQQSYIHRLKTIGFISN